MLFGAASILSLETLVKDPTRRKVGSTVSRDIITSIVTKQI